MGFWLSLGFSTLTCLLFVAVGALVWLFAHERRIAALLFGFCCAVAVSFAMETGALTETTGGIFSYFTTLGTASGMYLLATLLLVFPHTALSKDDMDANGTSKAPPRRGIWLARAYFIMLNILLLIELITGTFNTILKARAPVLVQTAGLYCAFMTLLGILCTVIISWRRTQGERARQQMRLLTGGLLLSLVPFLVLTLLPDLVLGGGVTYPYVVPPQDSIVTIGIFPIALGYTVLRHQVLVLDRYIRRIVTGIVAGILFIVLEYVVIISTGILLSGMTATICIAAFSALLVALLPRAARKLTESLFFPEFETHRQLFLDPERFAQETPDLDKAVELLSLALIDAFDLPAVAVFLHLLETQTQNEYSLKPELEPDSRWYSARRNLLKRLAWYLQPVWEDEQPDASQIADARAGNNWLPLPGHTILTQLDAARRPLYASEVGSERPFSSLARFIRDDSTMGPLLVPVHIQGKSIGFLVLSERSEGYAGPDFESIRLLLTRFAPFLDNCLLYERAREMELLAATDPLTRLPNHRALIENLEQTIERAQRSGHSLSLIFFDGDRFKNVNDTYGHAVGDAVLRELGARARRTLRVGDTLGRYGGEEFLVVLPETSADVAVIIAERVRAAVAAAPLVPHLVEGGIKTTISVGTATWPTDGATANEVLEQADQAMYWAKRLGRNQVRTPADVERACHNAALAATVSSLERRDEPVLEQVDAEQFLRADQAALVSSFLRLLELRTQPLAYQSYQMSDLAVAIAREMGMNEQAVVDTATSALLANIGMIGVPDSLLEKVPRLSVEEWTIVKQHPELGAQIIEEAPALHHLARAVRTHHESWDGSGFPGQIAGNAIPLAARIIAVAEAYHEMMRLRWSPEEARDALSRLAGTQFDPGVVTAATTVLKSEVAPPQIQDAFPALA